MLACEQPTTPVRAPEPRPTPPVPVFEGETPTAKTLLRREVEEIRAVLGGRGTYDPKRLADPNSQIDPSWDPKRVRLVELRQQGQTITIRGEARTMMDVAQFLKRLAADVWFADVTAMSGERLTNGQYRFEIRLRAPGADRDAAFVESM